MICGVDEAGKGPVMGPLVVAAVAVGNAKEIENLGIRDSKLLTKTKRKELAEIIKEKIGFLGDFSNNDKKYFLYKEKHLYFLIY